MRLLVAGGAGFIGSTYVCRHLAEYPDHEVVVLTVFDGHRLLPVEAMVEPGRQ